MNHLNAVAIGRRQVTRWTVVAAVAFVAVASGLAGQLRDWTYDSGSHTVTAELVDVRRGEVVLRGADGEHVSVPIERLSQADRDFIKEHSADQSGRKPNSASEIISEIAETFYSELRSEDRDAARETLTTKAQSLMKGGQTPLAGLPTPESGSRTIRVGRVKLEGTLAEVPVQVRADGTLHRTKLHLRREEDVWCVFALSATYPDGERSINFEAEIAKQQDAKVDPLAALVGKPLELSGHTVDGQAVQLAQYQGQVVLVGFWATWCGPCRAEIPNILANYQRYHQQGFDVIAVSVDQDLEAVKNFVAAEQPPWAVVADRFPGNRNSMAAQYGIRSIPALILVGQDGKVATVHCRGERLGQALAQLFGGSDRRISTNVRFVR